MPVWLVRATFYRLMREVSQHVSNADRSYVVFTDTCDQHVFELSEVLHRPCLAQLTASPTTCSLVYSKRECQRHIVTNYNQIPTKY